MKAESLTAIKKELNTLGRDELQYLCLRLSRFKIENKELLTYLLLYAQNEHDYIKTVQQYLDDGFKSITSSNLYYVKKSVRKILRNTKKYIRYSQNKETEVELLLYFCNKLKTLSPNIFQSKQLQNLYDRQIELIKKSVAKLHEDLQHDYSIMLKNLEH